LNPRRLKPLDWARQEIYEKVAHWFTVIGRELHDPVILAGHVYNMDEIGMLLSFWPLESMWSTKTIGENAEE
jgi:hypothetical protein